MFSDELYTITETKIVFFQVGLKHCGMWHFCAAQMGPYHHLEAVDW